MGGAGRGGGALLVVDAGQGVQVWGREGGGLRVQD